MMCGRKVLVAGGSGLVGMNLAKRLVKDGARVLASYYSREPRELNEVFRRFDFTSFDDCISATRGQDCVFLCAAHIFGAEAVKARPTAFILPNLQINAGLLEACSVNRVERVLLISSSTVYHEAFHPLAEDELDLNAPPYPLYFGVGWLNRYLEQLAALYQQKHGLRVAIVRPTSIYGPHDSFEDGKAHVVPALIKRALRKENPFVVWGNGGEVRNFLYVEDLVDDLLLLAGNDRQGEPINVDSGEDLTIREAAQQVLAASGHDVELQFDPTKPTAIPYRALNCTKAAVLLGPRPRTRFAEGVRKTIEWYQSTLT